MFTEDEKRFLQLCAGLELDKLHTAFCAVFGERSIEDLRQFTTSVDSKYWSQEEIDCLTSASSKEEAYKNYIAAFGPDKRTKAAIIRRYNKALAGESYAVTKREKLPLWIEEEEKLILPCVPRGTITPECVNRALAIYTLKYGPLRTFGAIKARLQKLKKEGLHDWSKESKDDALILDTLDKKYSEGAELDYSAIYDEIKEEFYSPVYKAHKPIALARIKKLFDDNSE
jgi:hypothetical protein